MPDLNIGGQAVIEGVMMRSKDRIATAVRIPNGEILVKTEDYRSLSSRHKILNIPILRGAIAFVEMLIIGIRTLNFSAEVAINEAEKEEAQKKGTEYQAKAARSNTFWLALSAVLAVALGILIFFFLPLAISNLFKVDKNAVWFNLVAGAIRLTMFVAYVWIISLFGEFKRIFRYHGAEHKAIFAHEVGDELTTERAACHTRFHPRCGTSFILIVALAAIFIYAISDTIYALKTGHPPTLLSRFGIHFSLLPIVAGGSYELLKLSGKTRDNRITRMLIKPGLWLQKITTKEPSMDQLEVGIVALKAALGLVPSNVPVDKARVP
ncbi:MAG: DUF1385 domain-containing protein [Candidatus Zixiibacteriota bacterium]|nr:MAG: DUF1385 domain-containing protein [candidate division Zixibacteria bacterium]